MSIETRPVTRIFRINLQLADFFFIMTYDSNVALSCMQIYDAWIMHCWCIYFRWSYVCDCQIWSICVSTTSLINGWWYHDFQYRDKTTGWPKKSRHMIYLNMRLLQKTSVRKILPKNICVRKACKDLKKLSWSLFYL